MSRYPRASPWNFALRVIRITAGDIHVGYPASNASRLCQLEANARSRPIEVVSGLNMLACLSVAAQFERCNLTKKLTHVFNEAAR